MTRQSADLRTSFYAPEDGGVGDFSIVPADDGWHLFHLYREFRKKCEEVPVQASRGINRKIGHAYSKDLLHWETKRPVLEIDPNHPHENLMLFGPSVINHKGTWYMVYTGVGHKTGPADRATGNSSRSRGGYTEGIQSICMARSGDLYKWKRVSNQPVFNIRDPKWASWSFINNKDCRDPYIMPYKKGYLLYYTSFEKSGPRDRDNGFPIIAAAYSENLVHWKDMGPVLKYRVWDKNNSLWVPLESPCVFNHKGLYYLFFNMYEAGHFCVFWMRSKDPACFNGNVNLFSDHFVAFKTIDYGSRNSYFAAFTNEYYGVLRFFKMEWDGIIPRIYVGPPEYKDG